jgi:two-component system, NtrC family, response regulator AtoC
LFFRLRVVEIWLPPLRERSEDIPLLAKSFLDTFGRENNKVIGTFAPEAMDLLLRYRWPGNVRELRTAIEHAVVLCRGSKITVRDLPPWVRETAPATPLLLAPETAAVRGSPSGSLSVKEAEKQLIVRALKETHGNRSEAAKRLGMSRRSLYRKMEAYQLEGH